MFETNLLISFDKLVEEDSNLRTGIKTLLEHRMALFEKNTGCKIASVSYNTAYEENQCSIIYMITDADGEARYVTLS